MVSPTIFLSPIKICGDQSFSLDHCPIVCPVSAKIDRRISRKGTIENDGETQTVHAGVQIQGSVRKLAAGHDARRSLPKVLGHLFDGEPVASSFPRKRAGD